MADYIIVYGRANGFCIYNDVAITAKYLATKYNQRVMVIDTDGHHGDGLNGAFILIIRSCVIPSMKQVNFYFQVQDITLNVANLGYGYTVNTVRTLY